MQHFGSVSVPLRSSEPMRRWRAEAEAKKRRQQAYAAEQEREWQERQRQAAMPEMPQVWIDAIGEAMSEYVANQVDGLRAEVERDIHRAVKRTYGTDEILDLPALPFRRRSDAA